MLKKTVVMGVLSAMLLLGSGVAHAGSDIFSVNFYALGRTNQGADAEWNRADWQETLTLEAGQSAGVGDWNTSGWENIVVPWNPGAPQDPVTIASTQGSTATYVLETVRNGAPYHWTQKRDILLGDGNADLMDGHANATEDDNEPFLMTVSDIPFGVYNVVIYLGANEGQFGDGTGNIVFNGGPEQHFTLPEGRFDGIFNEVVDEVTPSNYIVYEGVTGSSFTVRAWGNGFNHIAPTGFQFGQASPQLAGSADPLTEATDVVRDVVLGWTPGEFANTHDVYFGTSFDGVTDASVSNPMGVLASQGQGGSTYDPARLAFSETYYWRVDEVNGAPDFTLFKGDVWSFTTEPISIPITQITATASSSFGASGPENTINGSGLVDDLHGTIAGDMWISGSLPATVEYSFDRAYRLHELWIWNSNQVIEVFVGFGAKDIAIEHSLDGENWTVLEGVGPLTPAPGAVGYAHNNTIDFGGATARHVRVSVNGVQGIAPQGSLSEVRFFYIPTYVTGPNPAPDATNVAPDTTLSWAKNGREADRHEVYVGTDAGDLALAGAVSESSLSTDDLDLALGTTYTWRVDEVNEAMDPSVWTGDLWSFTTVETITVDDMETYKDAEFLEIWATWIDGFDDPANGSLVGGASGTPETGIVHGGSQSLPMDYDNSSAAVSEAPRTFDAPMDWTRHGVQSLVLYLNRGADSTGGGQVYVKINDTKILYEAGAGLPPGWDLWTQWTIDLSAVADAASVRSLTIGVEGADAAGVLYVDSIQLVGNAATAFQPLSWFEAESATMTAPLQVFADNPTASAGQYIGTIDGIGDENGVPPADGIATYRFDVPEDGVYQLAMRVIITGGSNSFWLRIPGMATNTTNHTSGWVRFNDISNGDAWHWDGVRSSDDGDSVVEFTLSAGTHTLEIARREDGTLLDAIALMK